MRKNVFLLLFLLFAGIPLTAQGATWTLNTWVKTAGGNIVVRNGTPQTSVNGSRFVSYTTSKPVPVTVNATTGYAISALTYNGAAQPLPIPSPASYTVQGPTAQSVIASFQMQKMAVSATAGSGGSVTPSGTLSNVYYGTQSPSRAFTFSPTTGNNVIEISINGSPLPASGPDLTYTLANATTGAAVTLPAPTNVKVKLTITKITYDLAIFGKFVEVTADAGPSQTVLPDTTVTLSGSGSPGPITAYSWTQTSGPAVSLTGASTATPSFIPTKLDTYVFSLVVSNSAGTSAPAKTYVYVTNDFAAVARVMCQNCHQANRIGTATNLFENWSSSVHRQQAVICYNCHQGANTGGHPGNVTPVTVDSQTFALKVPLNGAPEGSSFCSQCHSGAAEIVAAHAASPHVLLPNGPATCSGCHGDTHTVNASTNPCLECHADLGGSVFNHPFSVGTTVCTQCHNPHTTVPSGCDSCHDCPPATASHLKHYSGTVAQAGYGNTQIARDLSPNASGYIMNCGNCHPLDTSRHRNGSVDVELYNAASPADSLKARNPASAGYVPGSTVFTDSKGLHFTTGTCSNVYCHSYNDWTTPGGVPFSTDCSSYLPPNLVTTRIYRQITWGGDPLTCSGCHGNPPRTSYPANDGGSGDSHAWIDRYGYENLHNYNMGYNPVSCLFCHNETVKTPNTYTRNAMDVSTLSDVPISNFSRHVNGINDVAFDKQNPFIYRNAWSGSTTPMDLATAGYDPATKTCANVACHFNQTSVQWGTPYRWYDYRYECDRCHFKGVCR